MKIPKLLQAEVCRDEDEARIRGSYKTQGTYQSSRKLLNVTRGGREEIVPWGTVYRNLSFTELKRFGALRGIRGAGVRGEVSEQKRRKHGVVINDNDNN